MQIFSNCLVCQSDGDVLAKTLNFMYLVCLISKLIHLFMNVFQLIVFPPCFQRQQYPPENLVLYRQELLKLLKSVQTMRRNGRELQQGRIVQHTLDIVVILRSLSTIVSSTRISMQLQKYALIKHILFQVVCILKLTKVEKMFNILLQCIFLNNK